MESADPGPVSLLAFLGCVAWVVVAGVAAHAITAGPRRRARAAATAGLVAGIWLLASAAPTHLGWLRADRVVPAVPMFMVSILAAGTFLGLSPVGRRWAGLPLWALVAFQGFRLPLEVVLHAWVEQEVVPPQMTWSGANPDVVSGVLALVLAAPSARWRPAAWVAQGVGVVLLLNVIRVVVQSFDTPIQRFDEPVRLVFSVPEVWIGSVCVAGAWTGHVVALSALISPATGASPAPPAPRTGAASPSPAAP